MGNNVTGIEDEELPATAPADTALVPLRRNWRFQALWCGGAMANLGVEAVQIAFPLLILSITRSPGLAGLFGFVEVATTVLLTLPAGVLVDRWDRRHILLATEGIRALAIGAIAAAVAFSYLAIGYLIGAAVVLGAATALGAPARMLITRAVVPAEQLTPALSQEEARAGAAALAGPPVGGALFALARGFPFAAAALGFVVSFGCVLVAAPGDRAERPPQSDTSRPWSAFLTLFDALRFLFGHRALRAALVLISTFYLTVTAAILIVVVQLQHGHFSSDVIGLAVSGAAGGMLVGSALVSRLHKKLTPGRLLLGSSALVSVAVGMLAVPVGPVWVWVMLFIAALPVPALRVLVDLLIFRQTPDHSRGRVIAATMTVIGIGAPLGSLAAGVIMQFTTVTAAVLAVACLQAVMTAVALFDRHLRTATWPAR